jgi:Zn-dependent protease with chaperone function
MRCDPGCRRVGASTPRAARRSPGVGTACHDCVMGSERGDVDGDGDALQRELQAIAADIFVPPRWTLPPPRIVVDPHVPARNRALASARRRPPLILVSPRVLGEPVDVVRGTLAHEAGHLLGGRRGVAGWTLAAAVPLWAVAIACCVIGVQHAQTAQTSQWFAVALIPTLLALRLMAIPSRRCELRADRLSSQLVGVAAVVATLQHLDAVTPMPTRVLAATGMDSHPSPRQRIRHLLAV